MTPARSRSTSAKADADCSSIQGFGGTYDGNPHGAGGACLAVDGVTELGGVDIGATFTDVPGGTVFWTFTDVTGNYNDDSGSVPVELAKADADCSSITGFSGPYDGTAHGASGQCFGVDGVTPLAGLDLGASFTDVPGGTADWTFTDSTGNYNDDSGSVAIDIAKADADCSSITGFSGPYDGLAHGASGACLAVDGVTPLAGLDLGASFTDVPGGTADWTFTDSSGNYNDDSGSVAIDIGKAVADCSSIAGFSGTYDGAAHGASGACTGVDAGGAATGSTLDLGASFTDVPGGTADWTFTGGTNYTDQSGSVAIDIAKADADCSSITGFSGPYDGTAHGASGQCFGVDGVTPLAGLDLGASFTDVPGGTADWTFTDSTGNYNDDSGSVAIDIAKADADCSSITGFSGPYDGLAHGASGACLAVDGVTPLAGLDLGASFTDVPGGTADWTFTDSSGNYNDDSGSVAIDIGKADQTITFGALANKTYGDADFGVSATASSGLTVTFSSTTTSVCTVTGTTVHIVAAGSCTIQADQAGDATYNAAPAVPQTFSVAKADAIIVVNGFTGTYDGAPHGATGSATGVFAEDLSADLDLGATFTNVPGGTANWTFTDTTGNYNDDSGSVAITITKANQTITFGALAGKTYGDADFGVSATASSGLTVTFSSTTASVCTVTGTTVHLVAAGTCTIKADQAGNANYNAAPAVSRSFTVAKANQTISFAALAGKTYGAADFTVSATASSGLTVTFTSTTTGVCTVSGTTVHIVAAGTCTIKADQAGNANYNAAPAVSRSFTVAKANQTITFAALADKTLGAADFTVSATASSGLPVSFSSTTASVCTVSGSTVHLVAAGTCTIKADQAGNANYNAAPAVSRSFTVSISKVDQTITFGALADKTIAAADFTVSATASSGLTVTFSSTTAGVCTVSGSTVHIVAVGTCTIKADQAGNSTYNAAPSVSRSFSVTKVSQTITFGSLADKTLGDADFSVSATASSGLAVTFSSTTTSVCTVSGSTVHLVAVGTCTIKADQAGNATYSAAPSVSRSFSVTAAAGTVTRIYGINRYETAAKLSAKTFAPGVAVVYIATGENYPDALAGGPAAAHAGGPILLVRQNSIPSSVATELDRLNPGRIVVLGGPAIVSNAVQTALGAYTTGSVTRIYGKDRYATAAKLSAATFKPGVSIVYIVTGQNFPDALTAGPAAGKADGPILLVTQNSIPTIVANELDRLNPGRIVVLGGPAIVSNAVQTALDAYTTGTVTRINGIDRYATSAKLSANYLRPGRVHRVHRDGPELPRCPCRRTGCGGGCGSRPARSTELDPGLCGSGTDSPQAGQHRRPRRTGDRVERRADGARRLSSAIGPGAIASLRSDQDLRTASADAGAVPVLGLTRRWPAVRGRRGDRPRRGRPVRVARPCARPP